MPGVGILSLFASGQRGISHLQSVICLSLKCRRGSANFSVEGRVVNILSFVGHTGSETGAQLHGLAG